MVTVNLFWNDCSLNPPDRFVRRGRAAKADDNDFDICSDVEDGELISWLEKPGRSMAWQVIQAKDDKKLTKYLPPGNLTELYQHYVATRQLLGASVSSSDPKLFKNPLKFSKRCLTF